jgi:hypothetical protein
MKSSKNRGSERKDRRFFVEAGSYKSVDKEREELAELEAEKATKEVLLAQLKMEETEDDMGGDSE